MWARFVQYAEANGWRVEERGSHAWGRIALADVKQGIPSARLIEALPDFVGLTDVADMVGVTRQNMRKLMINHAIGFPAPVHEGKVAIWHLAEVLSWLKIKGNYKFDQSVFEVSMMTMHINIEKESQRLIPCAAQNVGRISAAGA